MMLYLVHTGFQAMLVISPQDTRKNFKPFKTLEVHTTQSVHLLLTGVLPPLGSDGTNKPLSEPLHTCINTLPSPEVISYHIDDLRLSLILTAALQRSIEHITRYLIQGLRKSLATMNMKAVGQLLMVDGSQVISVLSRSVLLAAQVSCPRYGFPPWSKLYSTESCNRATYSTAYNSYTQLKVQCNSTLHYFPLVFFTYMYTIIISLARTQWN